jgi:hypothetical protein
MTIRLFLHTSRKRAETLALLDSGATENFMSLNYASWLGLPLLHMPKPRNLFNVDGSLNRLGSLKFYTDLSMQTGGHRIKMRFFLSDLGLNKVILGYPWFAAFQPKIDWARGWIDSSNLPIIVHTDKITKTHPSPRRLVQTQEDRVMLA